MTSVHKIKEMKQDETEENKEEEKDGNSHIDDLET